MRRVKRLCDHLIANLTQNTSLKIKYRLIFGRFLTEKYLGILNHTLFYYSVFLQCILQFADPLQFAVRRITFFLNFVLNFYVKEPTKIRRCGLQNIKKTFFECNSVCIGKVVFGKVDLLGQYFCTEAYIQFRQMLDIYPYVDMTPITRTAYGCGRRLQWRIIALVQCIVFAILSNVKKRNERYRQTAASSS